MPAEFEDQLLAAYRSHRGPEAGRASRNWSRLQSTPPSPPPTWKRWIAWGGLAVLVAGLAALAWAWANRPEAPQQSPPDPPRQSQSVGPPAEADLMPRPDSNPGPKNEKETQTDTKTDTEAAPEPPEPEPPAPEFEVHSEPSPKRKTQETPSKAPKPETPTSLGDEVALIAQVKRELDRGNYNEALKGTREHMARYANGRLVDERRLLHVRALCGTGRKTKARREAARFLADKPKSALSEQVREACPE